MKTQKPIRHRVSLLAAAIVLLSAGFVDAQTFTTFNFTQIGPRQVVAVPTVYRWPIYRVLPSNGVEYWSVTMRTRNGTFTRSYRVDNSAQAVHRARQDFPNAWIVGASRHYQYR